MEKVIKPVKSILFRIYRNEPPEDTFTRIIRLQIQNCIQNCRNFTSQPDISTHEIRKSNKRIRAIYHLYRYAVGESNFIHYNNLFRKINHILSGHRVRIMYITWLKRLAGDSRLSSNNNEYMTNIVSELEKEHRQYTDDIIFSQKIPNHLENIYQSAYDLPELNPMKEYSFMHISEGLQKTYRKTQKRLYWVNAFPETRNLHNLRKSVKYLWNQLTLLRPLWSPELGSSIHQLNILGDQLGKDHDLAELENMLVQHTGDHNITMVPDKIMRNIRMRRRQLQKSAIPLAAKILAEKPDSFSGRISAYYKIFYGENL